MRRGARFHHLRKWESMPEATRQSIHGRVLAGESYASLTLETGLCRRTLRRLCPRPSPVRVEHPGHSGTAIWEALSEVDRAGIGTRVTGGDSYALLARETGIPRRTLARVCPRPAEAPIKSAWARLAVEVKAAIISRSLAGETFASMSREFGIAASTLQVNVQKAIERSKPKADNSTRVIAEKMHRDALAKRTDEILKRAGINPVSKFVGTEINKLRPLRRSFIDWHHRQSHTTPKTSKADLPTPAKPLPRGDAPVMDRRWGAGEGDR